VTGVFTVVRLALLGDDGTGIAGRGRRNTEDEGETVMHGQITRRRFLADTAAAGAALVVPWYADSEMAFAFSQSPALRKFVGPLRGIGPGGIPVAAPDDFPAPVTGVTHYSISMTQFEDQLHPDLGPTTLWGYKPAVTLGGENQPQRHLGGIIIAHHNEPLQITFTNALPARHIIPIDTSSNFPDARRHQNMTVTHVHGGFTAWTSDGIPTGWYTPDGEYGPSVPLSIYRILNPGLRPGQGEQYHTIKKTSRLAWYHDHAHDLTRTNVYAGLVSAFIIRDEFESQLRHRGLPDFLENGGYEIPILIQDKIFVGDDIGTSDPTWPQGLPDTPGSLWYAHTYDPARSTLTGSQSQLPDPSVSREFFGDTMLANGTVFPEATVEARRYRLRVLNACNARFLNLQLYVDDGSPDGITLDPASLAPANQKGPDFLVLGNEGGLLPYPVHVPSNIPFNANTLAGSLITSPAERWDMVVDFSGRAGQKVILYNDAPAPFPRGNPLNDYFPGAPNNPTVTDPGYGPDTRQIMRFNVVPATSRDRRLRITPATDLRAGNDPLPLPLGETALPPGVPVRRLTLNETADGYGRLIQTIGTDVPPHSVSQGFGRAFMAPATEVVTDGSSEVWQIMNLTADTHPIHFHFVNVQIISRQPFNAANYKGGAPTFTGAARPPDDYERGWKDTVRMNTGEVTSIFITFNSLSVPFPVPSSPRTGGHEYAWHCHILEHEEHDMMRPLVLKEAPVVPVTG
jgi:spore coat protein A, manganese oxidase